MRGKSYLQIGSVTMGIGGSIIDSDFIESYLGMRVESVDEVETVSYTHLTLPTTPYV